MRLIDADEIEKQFVRAHLTYVNGEENFGYTTLVFGSVIKNAPTIDAVPVVRCHKCNYYNEKVNMCDYRDVEVYDGDFCSWGTEVIE